MPYREPITQRVVYWLGESGSGFKPRSLGGVKIIEKIREACSKKDLLFEDEEFPANAASIGTSDANEYSWKRPWDIAKAPEFIVRGANRFDIKQGYLGNCWLLAAIADLTLNKACLDFTLTRDNSFVKDYCGAFHFRFWQYGKWIDVVVDDRLPVRTDNSLAFMRSQDQNEFWGALLEKAFAKLSGSYDALEHGYTFEALQDLTGGFTEVYMLTLKEFQDKGMATTETEVFDLMASALKLKSFLGSSVKAQQKGEKRLTNGLVPGHAYSITDLKRVQVKGGGGIGIDLLRLRNPYGDQTEWNGDFSDSSPLWEKYFESEVKHELNVVYRADGEFWMTITDFMEQFDRLEICHIPFFEMKDGATVNRFGDLVVYVMEGQWSKGATSGGPYAAEPPYEHEVSDTFESNPQFLLTLEGKAETVAVYICLINNERKAEGTSQVKSFRFELFDISNQDQKSVSVPLDVYFFGEHERMPPLKTKVGAREVTGRFYFKPGRYVIIPCTDHADCCSNFLLRVITTGESKLQVFDKNFTCTEDQIDVDESTAEELEEIEEYKKFFADVASKDEQMDWWELKILLDKTFHKEFKYEGFGFSEDECRSLVAVYDGDYSGRLDFFEFMKLWLNIKKWKKIFDTYCESQTDMAPSIKTPNIGIAFTIAGYSVSKQVLSRIILRFGDRKGQLSLAKFLAGALKLESTYRQFKKMNIDAKNAIQIDLENWLEKTMYA